MFRVYVFMSDDFLYFWVYVFMSDDFSYFEYMYLWMITFHISSVCIYEWWPFTFVFICSLIEKGELLCVWCVLFCILVCYMCITLVCDVHFSISEYVICASLWYVCFSECICVCWFFCYVLFVDFMYDSTRMNMLLSTRFRYM